MIRFVLRILGLLVLASGFAALVVDGTRSIAASGLKVISFGELCATLFPVRFPLLQPMIERQIHPLLWDPVLLTFLRLPNWLVLGVLGLFLLWLAQPRRAQIGYSSRP